MLGVHRAFNPEAKSLGLPELPRYVLRAHDKRLEQIIAAAQRVNQLVVVEGDSSTGKTRALWEAVIQLPDDWRLWQPADAHALRDGLVARLVTAQTVVWLDDLQNYLDLRLTPLAEANASALRELIAGPGQSPILVAATTWPHIWQELNVQRFDVGLVPLQKPTWIL